MNVVDRRIGSIFWIFLSFGEFVAGRPMDGKFLSLLNIVHFTNKECITTSSFNLDGSPSSGTCFTTGECAAMGGTASGNCASGFGVCCLLRLSQCGGQVNKNCTYIQNPGFPSVFTETASSCQFNFGIPSINGDNICRLRLDFDTFEINSPSATGSCGNENLNAVSSTGSLIPTLCGTLTSQHMYISTQPNVAPGSLSLNFDSTVSADRRWNIKVTYVDCRDINLPPDGCLQYLTGPTGSFQSYNFGQLIRNAAYTTCFRQEEGFCGINYSVSNEANSFKIGSVTTSKTSTGDCPNFRILIPSDVANVFCGSFLNNMSGEMLNGIISSSTFMVRLEIGDMDVTGTGYRLNYVQTPC